MVKTIFWPGVVNHHPRLRAFLPAAEHRVHVSGCAKGNFHVSNAGGIRIGFNEMVAKMPHVVAIHIDPGIPGSSASRN
jgi:hypothetical protein